MQLQTSAWRKSVHRSLKSAAGTVVVAAADAGCRRSSLGRSKLQTPDFSLAQV